MADATQKPTLHIEAVCVCPHGAAGNAEWWDKMVEMERGRLETYIRTVYTTIQVGCVIDVGVYKSAFARLKLGAEAYMLPECHLEHIEVGYCFDSEPPGHDYAVDGVEMNITIYVMDPELSSSPAVKEAQRQIRLLGAKVVTVPHAAFQNDWSTMNQAEFDDFHLPNLLRGVTHMLELSKRLKKPAKRNSCYQLCLFRGPIGTGKSTLSRALAQKLSISLQDIYSKAYLVEINTCLLLEMGAEKPGQAIVKAFTQIQELACTDTLVCVLIEEVAHVVGEPAKAGLMVRDIFLMTLRELRSMPNVVVFCNTDAYKDNYDLEFMSRVAFHERIIPKSETEARYNLLRSCFNELVDAGIVDTASTELVSGSKRSQTLGSTEDMMSHCQGARGVKRKASAHETAEDGADPDDWMLIHNNLIPDFATVSSLARAGVHPSARKILEMAENDPALYEEDEFVSLHSTILRHLPLVGLAKYTTNFSKPMHMALEALLTAMDEQDIPEEDITET